MNFWGVFFIEMAPQTFHRRRFQEFPRCTGEDAFVMVLNLLLVPAGSSDTQDPTFSDPKSQRLKNPCFCRLPIVNSFYSSLQICRHGLHQRNPHSTVPQPI